MQETFNKDLEELKGKQTMMNNTINEIKNSLEVNNSRIAEAEEWKSDLEDKIGNLPEKEFSVMIVKMIQNLGNRMEKIQETFNKDLEELKSKQTMMNKTKN